MSLAPRAAKATGGEKPGYNQRARDADGQADGEDGLRQVGSPEAAAAGRNAKEARNRGQNGRIRD